MAAEPAKKDPTQNVHPIKAKKTGKLPWIMLVVAVLAAGGAVGWWAFKRAPAAAPASGATTAEAAPPPVSKAAAIYYKFDPAFVVNFGGEGSARYFQVTVEVMSRDQGILDVVKNNEPAVRNDLVLLFSSQESATLLSVEGKEKLRAATLAAIQKVLNDEGANGKLIEQVYFTSFVIQ